MDRFSILDPNRPDNDISGGSSNTRAIMQCFSDAHSALQRRIGQLQSQPERAKESILGCILEGDYGSFDIQRSHLAIVHEHTIGPLRD
jgi:non-canonical poly(A) RNA polymerase PAPD5/7